MYHLNILYLIKCIIRYKPELSDFIIGNILDENGNKYDVFTKKPKIFNSMMHEDILEKMRDDGCDPRGSELCN